MAAFISKTTAQHQAHAKAFNAAAQTYLFATYNVHYVLGQYPVPDDFLPTDKAAGPTLLTV
ncbi:hypothetical protein [Kitasatospora sp. NA04385]|uniref:hypothetical protein n=1 Tax=Kitasatospora sp. NA04385 TaxID=2742135 RepID=UPI001C378985|nr:hypothetical protein [Kitasatospora sp. NA04385]